MHMAHQDLVRLCSPVRTKRLRMLRLAVPCQAVPGLDVTSLRLFWVAVVDLAGTVQHVLKLVVQPVLFNHECIYSRVRRTIAMAAMRRNRKQTQADASRRKQTQAGHSLPAEERV